MGALRAKMGLLDLMWQGPAENGRAGHAGITPCGLWGLNQREQ